MTTSTETSNPSFLDDLAASIEAEAERLRDGYLLEYVCDDRNEEVAYYAGCAGFQFFEQLAGPDGLLVDVYVNSDGEAAWAQWTLFGTDGIDEYGEVLLTSTIGDLNDAARSVIAGSRI